MRHLVDQGNGSAVVLLDSVSEIGADDRGSIVVTGSHGGVSAADLASPAAPGLVVFNDAGIGKEEAGIAGLSILDSRGIAAATVSHLTARIGEARDTLESGVISRVNEAAARLGLRASHKLDDALVSLGGTKQ